MHRRIEQVFSENFLHRGDLGASVSVWVNGREETGLASGFCDRNKSEPWTDSTLVLFWSATKGPAAVCVLHCLQEHHLSLANRVVEVWPEFSEGGKGSVTIGQLLSHQAGLAALSEEVSVFDHGAVIDALARQEPLWMPGGGHGYHPRTFGFLVDEIVRRLAGKTLGEYWREEFAEPLGLDLWIGLPGEFSARVSPVHASRNAPPEDAFWRALADRESLSARAFASPRGLHSVGSMNTPEARAASFPGFGGIGSARALAKFYAMLANGGELDGLRFFNGPALEWMTTPLAHGEDRVLRVETAFSAGFMKDPSAGKKPDGIFGPSPLAFGQPGAGGSVGFADPENGIAFAYVMNQMEPCVLPGERARRLIQAVYR